MKHVSGLERVAATAVMEMVVTVRRFHERLRELGPTAESTLARETMAGRRAFHAFATHLLAHLDESETVLLASVQRSRDAGRLVFHSLSACRRAFGIVIANHSVLSMLSREVETVTRSSPASTLSQLLATVAAYLEFEAHTLLPALEPFLERAPSTLRAQLP